MNDEKILELVNQFWSEAESIVAQYQQQWAINERLTNAKHITPRKPGRSAIFVPKIPSYVQRKIADFVGQFVGETPVTFKPTMTSDIVGAKIYQVVHNEFLDDIGYDSLIYNAAYCALVYNFAPAYIDFTEITDEKRFDADGEEVVVHEVRQLIVNVELLPPEDVFIDTSVSWDDIDSARYIGFRKWISQNEYEEYVETAGWKKVDDVAEYTSTLPRSSMIDAERVQNAVSPFSGIAQFGNNSLIEIRYHLTFIEVDGEYKPYKIITLADREVLYKEEIDVDYSVRNGRFAWPFVIGVCTPKPFHLYAPALPELARDLQIEINAIRNQRRDNVALILNPEKLVTPAAGVEPESLTTSFPGKVIPVRTLGSIQWQVPPDVTASGHNEESRAEQDMDRLFGEGNWRFGQPMRRKESATAIQLMNQNASALVGLNTFVFARSFVIPLNEKLSQLIRQRAPDEVFLAAAHFLGIDEDPDIILDAVSSGKFKINVFAGSQQQEFATVFSNVSNMIGLIQTLYGPNANYRPLIEKAIEALGFDPDQIIPHVDQRMPNVAAQDLGGVEPQGQPTIVPRAAFLGGSAMPENSGKQG